MKNILFFLTPKSEVDYIVENHTIKQALEVLKQRNHAAVPMISEMGKYIGTITEGDILRRFLEDSDLSIREMEHFPIRDIHRRTVNRPVSVKAEVNDLISAAMLQNFVPVIDDDKVFIGIVTRKEIMQYCQSKLFIKDK